MLGEGVSLLKLQTDKPTSTTMRRVRLRVHTDACTHVRAQHWDHMATWRDRRRERITTCFHGANEEGICNCYIAAVHALMRRLIHITAIQRGPFDPQLR